MTVEVLIPRKFRPFLDTKKRFKVAIGGRGSGKSNTFADIFICDAMRGIKTACFREFQNSIDDSVHALLKGEIERLGFDGFDCQQNKILFNGEEMFKFRGLARNPEGVKSMYGFKRFWLEEGQTISFESLKALTPTLRTEESEIWISANLRSLADPFSQRFFKPFERELRANGVYEDDLHLITWVNYHDNAMFPEVLEQERVHDYTTLSRALYSHIWEGEPYDEVENSIVPLEWFEAAIDAHEKLGFKGEGAIIAAHDPSDEGGDAKGYVLRHGAVVLDADEMTEGDVNVGCDWAIDKAIAGGADWFVWDCDGLGVTLKRQVDHALSGKKIDYFMYKGSESPENPEHEYDPVDSTDPKKRKKNREAILNKRAQYYMRLAKRFHNTYRAVEKGEYINPDDMISLSSSIEKMDQLRSEVCRIPLKRNNSGKLQIMSKLEMARKPYELPSPNMADSLMMAMGYVPEAKIVHEPIKFAGWRG
jgi:phage terminase large subunit